MNQSKGFTLVELMVVVGIISILVILGIPMGMGWWSEYQFSAATNNFINAAQLTRVRSIGGPITMNIYTNQGAGDATHGLQGSGQTFTVTVAAGSAFFFFTTLNPLSAPSTADIPLKVNDYVTLVGINNPDFLNSNLFRVKTINASTPTLDSSKPKYTYKVTSLSFTCESCSESSPGSCLQWPAGLGAQDPASGKVQVAACLRFTTTTDKLVEEPGRPFKAYAVQKYGNSLECIYDPDQFDLRLWVLNLSLPTPDPFKDSDWTQIAGSPVVAANSHPIVFDTSGATRNHDTYKVELRKITEKVTNPTSVAFIVWPTGRVTLDTKRQ